MSRLIIQNDLHRLRAELLATMCFPEDMEMRKHCFTHYIIGVELAELDDSERVEVEVEAIRGMLDAPSTEQMRELEADATKKGVVAGDLLAAVYLMDHFELDPEPSINKAIHALQQFAEGRDYGDGSKLWISERWIKQAWRSMKPVAHFWGAFRVNQAYPYCEHEKLFSSDDNLEKFLGVAATLSTFGGSFIPKRARPRLPIFGEIQLWQVGGPLSGVRPQVLTTERQPDALKEYLSSYEAPDTNFW